MMCTHFKLNVYNLANVNNLIVHITVDLYFHLTPHNMLNQIQGKFAINAQQASRPSF